MLEFLVKFSMLCPDTAIETNSIPATSHSISLPLLSSVQSELESGRPCEGRSSIKRTASMLASDGDHRSLFNFHIFEARLFIACSLESWVKRAASSQGSTSWRASTDKTLSVISSSSQSDANRKASYWDWRRESSVIPHSQSLWGRRHVANVAGVVAPIVYPRILLLFKNI